MQEICVQITANATLVTRLKVRIWSADLSAFPVQKFKRKSFVLGKLRLASFLFHHKFDSAKILLFCKLTAFILQVKSATVV